MARSRQRRNPKRKAKFNKKQRTNRIGKSKLKTKIPKKVKKAPMKITGLNEHCLFEIFKRLDIKDLTSVAKASESFTYSTLSVFKYKYANGFITVTNLNEEKNKSPLSTSLLYHFGKVITKLRVKYDDEYHRFDPELETAIVKHCRNSVTDIEFVNFDRFVFLNNNQPFRMVKKVVFTRCTVCKFIFEFNKWFPSAQSLDFVESKILRQEDAMKCLKQKFPMLDHLGIVNPRRADEDIDYRGSLCESLIFEEIFTGKNVRAAINLNPQLTSLKLKHNNDDFLNYYQGEDSGIKITRGFLVYVNKKLRHLEKLDLTVYQEHLDEGNIKKSQMAFKNLKKISFVFKDSSTLAHYPISTTSLTEITLMGNVLSDCYTQFLRNNYQCKKLVLLGKWESESFMTDKYQHFEEVIEALKQLVDLKSIQIHYNGLINKQNSIISLLNECKSLKDLEVGYIDESNGEYKIVKDDSDDGEGDQSDDDDDDDSKKKYLLKLKDALKHLPRWQARIKSDGDESSDFVDDEDEEEDEDGEQGNENANIPKKIDQNSFEETFRNAFEASCLGTSWQPTYTVCENEFWAKYEKH